MRIYVPLTLEELARLQTVAQRERRRPQDQAAVLLSLALAEEMGTVLPSAANSCATDQARGVVEAR